MDTHKPQVCNVSNHRIEANPDVAGIGVLVSFAISAVLVLAAILYGYFGDSLPETTLTRLDHFIIDTLGKSPPSLLRFETLLLYAFKCIRAAVQAIFARLRSVAPRFFGTSVRQSDVVDSPSARERRVINLQRFVLALSDQQLVTGLAILTAGYMQMHSMSVYHFNIVASLAWFSSATHLATLGVLKTYLSEHPAMRNWRVFAMLALFAMLFVALLPDWAVVDSSVPVSCFYSGAHMRKNFPDTTMLIITVGFLVITYVEGVVRLYSPDMDWNLPDFIIELLVMIVHRANYREPPYRRMAKERKRKIDANFPIRLTSLIRAERERERFTNLDQDFRKSRARVKSYVLTVIFVARELGYSFLGQIAILFTNLTFGFVQTFKYRSRIPSGGIDGNQNEMGFGQMLWANYISLGGIKEELTGQELMHHTESCDAPILPTAESETDVVTASSANAPSRHERNGPDAPRIPDVQRVYSFATRGMNRADPYSILRDPIVPQTVYEAQKYSIALTELMHSLDLVMITIPLSAIEPPLESGNFGRLRRSRPLEPSAGDYDDRPTFWASFADSYPEMRAIGGSETGPDSSTPPPAIKFIRLVRSGSREMVILGDEAIYYHPVSFFVAVCYLIVCFQVDFEILFALAVAGVFGNRGYTAATAFLVVLLVLVFAGSLDGFRQRMREVKREATESS